jgi:hypothetical protein
VHVLTVMERIVNLYWHVRDNGSNPNNEWLGLVDLRPQLVDIPRAQQDEAFRNLSAHGLATLDAHDRRVHARVILAPESDRKTLTEADHEAAIRIGGDDNHLIAIQNT